MKPHNNEPLLHAWKVKAINLIPEVSRVHGSVSGSSTKARYFCLLVNIRIKIFTTDTVIINKQTSKDSKCQLA